MPTGRISLVLHAHLPYVRHPEHEFHLEERWLFEALHETYLPLIEVARRLARDDVSGTITLSVSPPLLAMLEDELLVDRFERHLERMVELAEREVERRPPEKHRAKLAAFYRARFRRLQRLFVETLDRSLVAELGRLDRRGTIELMTAAGTHGLLPLMRTDASRRAHVHAARRAFERRFDRPPRGMWLPECGYDPSVDAHLADAGIEYSFLESHALEGADTPPVWGTAAPLVSESGVAYFGRDRRASRQVWSADGGYPGHPDYREFYRDLGYDLDEEELETWPTPAGDRFDTGLKYHRVTGDVDLDEKALYHPERAESWGDRHARHFVEQRLEHARSLTETLEGRTPHVTCPYDAELFGHWWFEGPLFLEEVARRIDETDELDLVSPGEYLDTERRFQMARPATSTWGEEGDFTVWVDDSNAWIYRHLHHAEEALVEMAGRYGEASDGGETLSPEIERALRQLAREVMLAQASDWAFIIKQGTTVEYAMERLRDHLGAARALVEQLKRSEIDTDALQRREARYGGLLSDLEWRLWAPD